MGLFLSSCSCSCSFSFSLLLSYFHLAQKPLGVHKKLALASAIVFVVPHLLALNSNAETANVQRHLHRTQTQYRWSEIVKPDHPDFSQTELQSQEQQGAKILLRDLPEWIVEGGDGTINSKNQNRYREWRSSIRPDAKALIAQAQAEAEAVNQNNGSNENQTGEVRTLVDQGPSANRIDLTIVGDGYTLAERERFFADARRITDDLFAEQTFASYLPLFNVHAVFVPSRESGITDLVEKDTALGLFRTPKGSKRAIMPGNPDAIDRAVALARDTDYPILLANDDFYGGLGGRYAITTRSIVSGPVVLRHELGHNFGNVGEEYDGGSVYQGANNSGSSVKWKPWLSPNAKVFDGKYLHGAYVWQSLSDKPYKGQLDVPQDYSFVRLLISSVGWATDRDVRVTYDGVVQSFSAESYTQDRSFLDIFRNQESAGRHEVVVEDGGVDRGNVLAFVTAVAHKADIVTEPNFIAAYPTFSDGGYSAGYRPTFEGCLMREMRTKKFCSVDQENMWLRFLNVVDLIDEVQVAKGRAGVFVWAKTPPLQGLMYEWKNISTGEVLKSHSSELELPAEFAGKIEVTVKLQHPEIRSSSSRLQASQIIDI